MSAETTPSHLQLIDTTLSDTTDQLRRARRLKRKAEVSALEQQQEQIGQLRAFETHRDQVLGGLSAAVHIKSAITEARDRVATAGGDLGWVDDLGRSLDERVTLIEQQIPTGLNAVPPPLQKVIQEDQRLIQADDDLSKRKLRLTAPAPPSAPTKSAAVTTPPKTGRVARARGGAEGGPPPERPSKLADWFKRVKGAPIKIGNAYYLEDIKTGLLLPQDFIQDLALADQPPFNKIDFDKAANRYTVDLNQSNFPYELDLSGNARYQAARQLFPLKMGGFLEMAAAIGSTPAEEEKIAREMLIWITRHHLATNLDTLKRWRESLKVEINGQTGLKVLENIELRLKEQGVEDKEALLVSMSEPEFERVWKQRLEKLQLKAQNNEQFNLSELAHAQLAGLSIDLKKAFLRYKEEVEKQLVLPPTVQEKKDKYNESLATLRRNLGVRGSLRYIGSKIPGLNKRIRPDDDPVAAWEEARREYLAAQSNYIIENTLANLGASSDLSKLSDEEYRIALSSAVRTRLIEHEQVLDGEEIANYEEMYKRVLDSHRHWKRSLVQGFGINAGAGVLLHFINPAPVVSLGIQAARVGMSAVKLEPALHALEIRASKDTAFESIPEDQIRNMDLEARMRKFAQIYSARIQQALVGGVPDSTPTERSLHDSIYGEIESQIVVALANGGIGYKTAQDRQEQILLDQINRLHLDQLEGYKAAQLKESFSVPRRLARYTVAALASVGVTWLIDQLIQDLAPQVADLINELKSQTATATAVPTPNPTPPSALQGPSAPTQPPIPTSGEMTFPQTDTYFQHLTGNGDFSSTKGAVEVAWMQRHNMPVDTAHFTQFHLMADNNPAIQRQLGAGEFAFHQLNSPADFMSSNPDFLLHHDIQGNLIHYKEPDWGKIFDQAA